MPVTTATSEGTRRRKVLKVPSSESRGLVERGEIWEGGRDGRGEGGRDERGDGSHRYHRAGDWTDCKGKVFFSA